MPEWRDILTKFFAGIQNLSLVKLVPSGADQLEGVAVVFKGDPVWTIHLMGALHRNLIRCGDDLFCNTQVYIFISITLVFASILMHAKREGRDFRGDETCKVFLEPQDLQEKDASEELSESVLIAK